MSWWEKWDAAKNWVNNLGKQATDAAAWGGSFLNHNSSAQTVSGKAGFVFETIFAVFEQIRVIPKVAYSMMFHTETHMVTGHVLRIAMEDLLPLVMVSYANDLIQQHGANHLDEQHNPAWLTTNTLLSLGLSVLNTATYIYKTRKYTQMMVRTVIVSLEAGNGLTVDQPLPQEPIVPEPCSTLRFIKGSFRYTTAFWATEAAISLIRYIPIMGETTAILLSTHHRGRYIMTVVLADLCNHHQVEYIKENTELALALGIGHATSTALVNYGIESVTGVPKVYYEGMIRQFMMLVSVSVAAHMTLPAAIAKSQRVLPDPVALYQDMIGWAFDTLAIGVKKQIPLLLQGSPSTIRWDELATKTQQVCNHPYTKKMIFFAVPRLLRSKKAFIDDPVIAPNWDGLRQTIIHEIENVEQIKGELMVQMASLAPSASAKALWLVLGIPKSVTKLLLSLINNDEFMMQLGSVRRRLEQLQPNSTSEIIVDSGLSLAIREKDDDIAKPVIDTSSDEKKNELTLLSKQVIKPASSGSSTQLVAQLAAKDIIQPGVALVSATETPKRIIRQRFFSDDPRAIIRPGTRTVEHKVPENSF